LLTETGPQRFFVHRFIIAWHQASRYGAGRCHSSARNNEETTHAMKHLMKAASSRRIADSALRVSLVVGTLLNAINQGSELIAWQDIAWSQVILNYCVPYCVASYSAARNQLSLKPDR